MPNFLPQDPYAGIAEIKETLTIRLIEIRKGIAFAESVGWLDRIGTLRVEAEFLSNLIDQIERSY